MRNAFRTVAWFLYGSKTYQAKVYNSFQVRAMNTFNYLHKEDTPFYHGYWQF